LELKEMSKEQGTSLKAAAKVVLSNATKEAVSAVAAALALYKTKRIRVGKTRKDHLNGAKSKNQQNKDSRYLWQQDSKRAVSNFPWAACNGQRNRYQVTGKDGATIYLRTPPSAASGKGR
jgi:hypothetical protein